MPQRERYLWVCTNERVEGHPMGSCARSGSRELLEALKKGSAARGINKTKVRVCGSTCLDVCWAGPAIAVMPDGKFYGRVTPNDVPEILDSLEKDEIVERLVLGPNEFDNPNKGAA